MMVMMEGTKILVLDRGFVLVGRIERHPELAFHWLVRPGRTIRRWGTTKGLAELCAGPTSQTVLDAPVTRSVPFRAIIEILEASDSGWAESLRDQP